MTCWVASLGMYDHAAQQDANDAIWSDIARRLRARGIDAPPMLDRARPVEEIWRDPNPLFAQACGLPLVTEPDLELGVIGVPIYDAPHCDRACHRSLVVARADDRASGLAGFRDRIAAINSRSSNTGCNLLRALVASHASGGRFFASVVATGSHRASAEAVVKGAADIAAVDAVTHAAWARYEPGLVAALRIVTVTAAVPSLPFVTARDTSTEIVAALRSALAEALSEPALAEAREALLLTGVREASAADYAPVLALANQARAVGYPELS